MTRTEVCLATVVSLVTLLGFMSPSCTGSSLLEGHACFSRFLDVDCGEENVIVFESANYGRNDTRIAQRCGTPYQRNCDVDVNFILNRKCAGKHKCSVGVNTALFGDPCGYEEFLRVTYRCVEVSLLHQTCSGPSGPVHYEQGYIASPNYPFKYYMDAECYWDISVQKRQTIKVSILDFELDVKRHGMCHDVMQVKAQDRIYFEDCGALGRQEINIDSNEAEVRFETSKSSLAQRGFLLYFEAVGPGCPDLEEPIDATVEYYIIDDVLYANASCREGYLFAGTEVGTRKLTCEKSFWNIQLSECLAILPPTMPPLVLPTSSSNDIGQTTLLEKPETIIDHSLFVVRLSIALGIVSAILLITLLIVLAMYFHRRRRNAERKLDQWRVVINNLQDNAANEENLKRAMENGDISPSVNVLKVKNKKQRNKAQKNTFEDELQDRNLLKYEDEDFGFGDNSAEETYIKYPDEYQDCHRCGSRRNSRAGKYALARSRDSNLNNGPECDNRDRPRRRDLRHRRAKSGQWDGGNRSGREQSPYEPDPEPLTQQKRAVTHSAPDLLELFPPRVQPVQQVEPFRREQSFNVSERCPHDPVRAARLARSSTLGHGVPPPAPPRPIRPGSRSNSRGRIKC